MSLKILNSNGKPLCITDMEDGQEEFFIVDNKKYTEQELRADKDLFDRFNNDIKNQQEVELND